MSDIVTITMNPAVDLSTSVDRIVPVFKLRGTSQRRDPGGGGINVARVIRRLGGAASAVYPVGGSTGELLRKLLAAEGVASRTFAIADETRENFFVSEGATGQQYRFILPGPQLTDPEWRRGLELIAALDPFPRFLVASGSLPRGVPDDFYARVAALTRPRGARLILDTSGAPLAAAVAQGVDLVKPNLSEMRALTGRDPSDAGEWEAAARDLVRNKRTAMVALTMGHLGAALVTQDGVLRARPLAITPQSATGAGDSFLAALLVKLAAGAALHEAFRHAVAAGAAALLHPGTDLCRSDDVERLAAQVIMEAA